VSIRRAEAAGEMIHVPYYHKYDGVDPGDSKSRAKLGRYARQAHAMNSLTAYIDEPMWVEDDPCARLIDREEAEERAKAAAAVLAMLSPRDYEIITSRLIDGESLKRVGARVKLSGERVRHLELAAIDKIRNHPAFARYAKGA
jgi:DNA-directed RNA polymerase sigma subunit (sigma70/sigma32)